MVSQASAGREALAAASPCAAVVSDFRVCTLEVVFQMSFAKVSFRATLIRALENSVVGVGSDVFFQACGAIECFRAILIHTEVLILFVAREVLVV